MSAFEHIFSFKRSVSAVALLLAACFLFSACAPASAPVPEPDGTEHPGEAAGEDELKAHDTDGIPHSPGTEKAPETAASPETTGKPETTGETETALPPETTAAPETTAPETTAKPETTKAPETTAKPPEQTSPPTIGDPANWSSVYVGTVNQETEARKIAKQIADSIGPGTDLERIAQATLLVSKYTCNYKDSGNVYMTAYSVFVLRESCCWGYTSALGMVLDYMGYSWRRGNYGVDAVDPDVDALTGSKHQWVIVNDMDGHVGYADADACRAYYGAVYGEQSFPAAHGNACTETVIVAPTCTESGRSLYTCRICGISSEKSTAPLGHDYSTEVIAPTETERGYSILTCRRCGYTTNNDYTYATKTCEENGREHEWGYQGRCLLCGARRCLVEYGEHIWTRVKSGSVWYEYCQCCLIDKCVVEHGDHYWMPSGVDPGLLEELMPGEIREALEEECMRCYYCGVYRIHVHELLHDTEP